MPFGKKSTSSDQRDADDRADRPRCSSLATSTRIVHQQRAEQRPERRRGAAEQHPEQRQDRILDRGEGRADIAEQQRIGGAGGRRR